MRSVLFLSIMFVQALALADQVTIKTYQDIIDNSYPINLAGEPQCTGGSISVPNNVSFEKIHASPVLTAGGTNKPSEITKLEVVALKSPQVTVIDILVDLTVPNSIYFDPNQSGDPIFRFRAQGVDMSTRLPVQIECMSSY